MAVSAAVALMRVNDQWDVSDLIGVQVVDSDSVSG